MGIDREAVRAIKARLQTRRGEMIDLLRELVRVPSFDGDIGRVASLLRRYLTDLGFADVHVDPMGNLAARMGSGPRTLLYDSHLDTVGVSDRAQWAWDPFEGRLADGVFYGLGAGDEKGSTPPMVFALATLRELGLARDWTLYYFGNVEEWCEGLSGRVFVEHEGVRPDFVVVGESTGLKVYRGQRGRVELAATVTGRAAHGSAPERGDNAIYRATPLIQAIAGLGARLPRDEFLGAGTIAVTRVSAAAGSANVIPDRCDLYVDRRLTLGETPEGALAELRALPEARGARIEIPRWARPSYTGYRVEVPLTFPTWVLPADHPLVGAAQRACEACFGRQAPTGRWAFSTNGVYWQGVAGIPTIGFGPGDEATAHTVLDSVPVQEVWDAADYYATLPLALDDLPSA
jgi:putative selenium metabolism hydrolase